MQHQNDAMDKLLKIQQTDRQAAHAERVEDHKHDELKTGLSMVGRQIEVTSTVSNLQVT